MWAIFRFPFLKALIFAFMDIEPILKLLAFPKQRASPHTLHFKRYSTFSELQFKGAPSIL